MITTLGIHFGSHDTSAALVRDGSIIAMIEQERFDHIKHTIAFPADAIRYCIEQGNLALGELDFIAYASDAEVSNLNKQSFIESRLSREFIPKMNDQKAIEGVLSSMLGIKGPFFFVDHHKAHAASAFYPSPYERAAIFTIDGMGNWLTATGSIGEGTDIKIINQLRHPHSLGLMYGALTQYLGFRAACDECKVMGLAAYGRPAYLDEFREICSYKNGKIELDLDYFTFHNKPLMRKDGGFNTWYSEAFLRRFGLARIPESEITERHMDLAHSMQALLEERTFQLLSHLYSLTKIDKLCLSGGVALNSSMNAKIPYSTPFKEVYIFPAANDAGLSLGTALYCNVLNSDSFKRSEIRHAYYGSEYSAKDIEGDLKDLPSGLQISRPDNLIKEVAKLLDRSFIVGWFQGRMEIGPRALGNRSILASPARPEMKDALNQKVKFREGFRPFAPSVPLEYASDYFEVNGEEMPFMLKVVNVKPGKKNSIPAVTHVDNTARIQTVTKEQNPLFYELLYAVKELNGVPVLLNTSFNIRGDTIVRTPSDAIKCFLNTGMNALAIGPFLLKKGECDSGL